MSNFFSKLKKSYESVYYPISNDIEKSGSTAILKSILSRHLAVCKPGDLFIYLPQKVPSWFYLHLLSIVFFVEERKVFGFHLGNNWTGYVSKCEFIEPLLKHLETSKDLNVTYETFQTFFYHWDPWTREILDDYDLVNCRFDMISPCNEKYFDFRCEVTNTVDLGLLPDVMRDFLPKIGVEVHMAGHEGGVSCFMLCLTKGMDCEQLLYPIVNNCAVMKTFTKCKFCMTYDEGNDHPFSFQDRCRLRTNPAFSCEKIAPPGAMKVCPCIVR